MLNLICENEPKNSGGLGRYDGKVQNKVSISNIARNEIDYPFQLWLDNYNNEQISNFKNNVEMFKNVTVDLSFFKLTKSELLYVVIGNGKEWC